MSNGCQTALVGDGVHTRHDHDSKMNKKEEVEVREEMLQEDGLMDSRKATTMPQTSRERKIALQQEVNKLKRRLRHEENVHRALERAFTRPLGVLPRLPPCLPPQMLELLAEVAVLEEEVVRLEEQVINFRQGLYQEAIILSSSRKINEDIASDLYPCPDANKALQPKHLSHSRNSVSPKSNLAPESLSLDRHRKNPYFNRSKVIKRPLKKLDCDQKSKRNQCSMNSKKTNIKSSQKKVASTVRTFDLQRLLENSLVTTDEMRMPSGGCPNKISEDLLKCLLGIYVQMSSPENQDLQTDMPSSVFHCKENSKDATFLDPYSICLEFGRREIGRYKQFLSLDKNSINPNILSGCSVSYQKLRFLLNKLELVDLKRLNHQEKLAFWINIYNSCMMNSFLENGIPLTAQMVVTSMQKAMINVGGRLLNAMTIEHFILRLPNNSNGAFGSKDDEMAAHGYLGLDWPEPLVTFALSCGSWSSPAIRVYTASKVESELEMAKRDYLQAAVGISRMNELAIPKLLHWYLLDFAKDVESLVDWICLQLPDGLRNDAIMCLKRARKGLPSQAIRVFPYDFSFRYLLAT